MTKTALVTGSAGFIGRHFVKELESRGYEVDGFDIAATRGGLGDVIDLFAAGMGWSGYCDHQYDLVVHAAYHVGGRVGIDGKNVNFLKNVQLDSAMFEWAVRTEQNRVLYFSSSAVYPIDLQGIRPPVDGNGINWRRLHEVDARIDLEGHYDWWGGINPAPDANYGFAKLVGERLAEDAVRNGLRVSVVRPFSGYGEDQSLDYPFPSIVQRAREGDLSVWGPRGQSRDWIHVSDVVNGALAVVESETTDPVNLCTGVATEMGELAQMVGYMANCKKKKPDNCNYSCEYCDNGISANEATYDESKPFGVFYRVGDPKRMLQYYTPKVSLEEGIRRALDAQ